MPRRCSSSSSTGPQVEVDHLIERVVEIANATTSNSCRVSQSEDERLIFWAGRKAAFPAVGRISPDYLCMDGTIPRKRLPEVLHGMAELSRQYGLRVANVFHAGDGNLHPLILFDANDPDELDRAEEFGADILQALREGGRRAHRRAWRRHREARPDAGDVLRGRSQPAAAAQMRLRRSRACSIPARSSRCCIAAPSSAAWWCRGGKLPLRRSAEVLT